MASRRTPQPTGYCPVLHRAHLPIDTMTVLPTYGEQHRFIRVVDRCLCNSVAHLDIRCDPQRCALGLTGGLEWALTTDNPVAAFGGSCKRIFREYNNDRMAQARTSTPEFDALMAELWAEDE